MYQILYQILCSGCNDGRHYTGVGFAGRKALLETAKAFTPINERMCTNRLKGRFSNIAIVTFYVPTDKKEHEVIDTFYAQLEEITNKLPNFNLKLLKQEKTIYGKM